MMTKTIKKIIKSSIFLTSAAYLATDLRWHIRMALGNIETDSGTIHATFSEADSLHYIQEVFTDYKRYGLIEKFQGFAAELGPGDNAGVALLMRHDGCEQVDLVDRFFSKRNIEQQRGIYESLARRYALDAFRLTESWDDHQLAGINWKIGQAAEVYFQKCNQNQEPIYNFIVSRAVLEHLYDPLDALQHMVASLKPGGQMLHKIDLRDHAMFTPTHHELTFLEIPSPIYRRMVRNSGRPNRILVHDYQEVLEEMKSAGLIDYSLLVTRLVDVGDITPHQRFEEIDANKQRQAVAFVEKHQQKFVSEFHHVDNYKLAISGIFLIVNKK